MKKVIYLLFITALFATVSTGCKNPMLGLGPAADIEAPSGSFNIYENGDYVRGSIVLDGISEDDVKIDSVRAVLDFNVIEAELTVGEITSWSLPIDTAEYPDGEYTIVLYITDSSGRETEKRLMLYFDNTAPTVMVTSTEGIASGASTNFPLIRGEAYDYLFSRIDHMEAAVVSGNAEIISFQGTNGWSMTLKTTGTGNYAVKITAFDTAGNSNAWLYHSSDFPVNTKIEDIADSESAGQLGAVNLVSVRKSVQDIEVDLSLDEPRIVISNPEEGKTASENILGGTSVAVGYIEDDDEVDASSVSLSLDGGSTWTALSGAQLSGSGGFIRWNYDLSSLENGVYNLQLKAADTGKPVGDSPLTAYSSVTPFTIDKTAPSVSVSSPAPGSYQSSENFTISGDAEDISGSIQSVRISVNSGAYENASTFSPGESVSWSHNLTAVPAGAADIRVEAVDDSGKTSHYNMQIYVDLTAPTVEVLSPAADLFINGTTTLQGVCSDNWSLKQVKLQIGGLSWAPAAAETLPPAEFYSWQRNIISSNYENTGMAVEVNGSGTPQSGTGIWELKIWVEAVDKADNPTLKLHRVYIDNSLDRPGINIASPSGGAVLAGSVMLSGSAWDDKNESGEDLNHIELRIWKGEDAAGDTTVFTDLFDLNTLLGLNDVYGDDSWYEVPGTSTWQTELNTGGEFYPNGTDHNGTVKIEVRAVDEKGGTADLAGNIESVEVTFDDTVPFFSGLSHSSGDYERGIFNLTGTVNDDDSVERLRVSYNGGVDWTVIGTSLGASSLFSHSINTNSIIGNSGILYLRLEALDTANYKTLASVNLNIDNLNPTGSYIAGVTGLNGTARVQGTASDIGTVAGVDRIEVSFTLDGVPVNALSSKGVRTPITIDSRSEVGDDASSNGDDDGFNESMSISGSLWSWWADFNTLTLDDGVLNVIYTIYDNAGNIFTETITNGSIKNHAPSITSVSAGWDFDHDGTVEGGESRTYSVNSTESNSVYGDLSYSFNTDYDGLNGALTYGIRIRPVPSGSWVDLGPVSSAGSLDTTSATAFTAGDGNYAIEFKVNDTKNYESLLTLMVTVENSDTAAPSMDFYELTSTDAADVKAADSGHIEIDGNIYLSGLIPFTGRAEDNQKIQTISISIDGGTSVPVAEWDDISNRLEYTGSGLPLETGSGFIEEGGVLKHIANWKYVWNSAELPAGLGTTIRFIVEDSVGRTHFEEHTYDVVPYISGIETALVSSFSDTMARSAEGRYPVLIESSESTYETITVNGWNIDSSDATTTTVRLSSDPDGLDTGVPVGTALAYTNSTADDNKISVAVDAAGSGYFTVIVDGVPSRNNINTNSKTYNAEASDIHQSLSDDRYLSLWDITRLWRTISLADHAVYPAMAMSGDTPHFSYANNSMGWGQGFYLAGTVNKHIIQNWDLFTYTAIDLNSSGNHAALVDVNVVNGNYGDYNAGNYGGIFTNFWYDVPAHAWGNRDFLDNGLWLENLVDTSGTTTAVLNRYQYPDIELNGDTASTDVFYSVYDTLTGRLIFRHFLVGTSSAIGAAPGGRFNNQGTALYSSIAQAERDGTWPEYNGDDRFTTAGTVQPGATPADAQYISSTATSFSAVGATSDGSTAVIAYYDTSESGKLVFRYNTTPDSSAGWSTAITIEEFVNAQYIDMKVDANDHIHIAYYDSFHGDVKYAYISAYNSPPAVVYTVDSSMIVGSKLTLDVGVPAPEINPGDEFPGDVYIAYKGLGDSAKVAWLKGPAADGAVDNEFTGSWEVQTIPELIVDSDSNRFNVGVDTAGNPVVGYTDDGLEYVKLLDELVN